jgi:hypothetical protein
VVLNWISIFEAGTKPVRGMTPDLNAASMVAVGKGYAQPHMQEIINYRWSNRDLRVRDGCVKRNSSGPTHPSGGASFSYRGHWAGYVNNEYKVYVAFKVSGTVSDNFVKVYEYDPSANSYTAMTDHDLGKPWGQTDFTQDKQVSFCVTKFPGAYEKIIAQNGFDQPRIISSKSAHNVVSGVWAGKLRGVGLDSQCPYTIGDNLKKDVTLTIPVTVRVLTGSHGASGFNNPVPGNYKVDTAGTGIAKHIEMTVTTSAVKGNIAVINVSNAEINGAVIDLSESKQLIMIVDDTGFVDWLNQTMITLEDASGNQLYLSDGSTVGYVYDGQAKNIVNPPIIAANYDESYPSRVAVAFDISHLLSTGTRSRESVGKIKFTYVGKSLVADQLLKIWAIAGSGKIQGGATYAITFSSGQTGEESVPYVLKGQERLVKFQEQYALSDYQVITAPNSTDFYYTVTIGYQIPEAIYYSSGVDRVNFYRQDIGEEEFSYVGQEVFVVWNVSAWVPASGAYELQHRYVQDSVGVEAKRFNHRPPGDYHRNLPIGYPVESIGGRVIVGAPDSIWAANTGRPSYLWVSEKNQGTRFTVDASVGNSIDTYRTGAALSFDGEQIVAIWSMPSRGLDRNSIAIGTNNGVWQIDARSGDTLFFPTLISRKGVAGPRLVAFDDGFVFYLDTDYGVRQLTGSGAPSVSRGFVDTVLASATMEYGSIANWNNRIYILYRSVLKPDGTANSAYNRMLVYDMVDGSWGSDYFSGLDFRALMRYEPSGARVEFWGITNGGDIYKMEVPGQATDAGTSIFTRLKTPVYHDNLWRHCKFGRVGMLADAVSSTLTVTRAYTAQTGASVSGSMNLATSGANGHVWESAASSARAGGAGVGVQLTIDGTILGGTKVASMVMEMTVHGDDKAVRSN